MSGRPVRIRIKKLVLPDGSQADGDRIKTTLQRALRSHFQAQLAQGNTAADTKAQVTQAIQRALKE